jgi:hydrogenase nickel incorporation protein HypA/HybF
MHELSVAQSMMSVALENAAANNAVKISRIELVVGGLSGVTPDSLLFCFQALREGTIAENAELVITVTAAIAHCAVCNSDFEVGMYDFFCPRCQNPVIPKGGDELFVKDIDIE